MWWETVARAMMLFSPLFLVLIGMRIPVEKQRIPANFLFYLYGGYMLFCLVASLNLFPRGDLNHLGGVGMFWGLVYLIITLGFSSNLVITRLDAMLLGISLLFPMMELWELPIHLISLAGNLESIALTLILTVPRFLLLTLFFMILKRYYSDSKRTLGYIFLFTIIYIFAWRMAPLNLLKLVTEYETMNMSWGVFARMSYVLPILFIISRNWRWVVDGRDS